MGFLSRLFGGSGKETQVKDEYQNVEPVEYKGFLIYASAIKENGQYRVAGKIEQHIGDAVRSHRFIRSDVLMSESDANEIMVSKAKLFIDQMGEKIFD